MDPKTEPQGNVEASVAPPALPPTGSAGSAGDVNKDNIGGTTNGLGPLLSARKPENAGERDPSDGPQEDTGVKSDSEAETIVLPGKDGHSPQKVRKSIKHEDKSDSEDVIDAPKNVTGSDTTGSLGGNEVAEDVVRRITDGQLREAGAPKSHEAAATTSMLGKRKRHKHINGSVTAKDDPTHLGNSSGLSSVPTSPVATIARSSLSKPTGSDSDISRSPSPRTISRDKARSVDRALLRRKHYASDSEDDDQDRIQRSRSNANSSEQGRTRSDSPRLQGHRRSLSTQHSRSTHGVGAKKKRVPAPLQSTEYQSDDSSASGSSRPQSSRSRRLAPPMAGDSAISPARVAPHKKHVNSSGQTLVARACASGKLDLVKRRLDDRPEDLDEADHANNTPLHAASIAGHADIVKLLLGAGCIVDPVNLSRDTPLHDAIDNGHLDCVKLLLNAGANPRKANGKGEDPYDLVDDEDDTAAEMKEAINAAKQRTSDVRRPSEDGQIHDNADGRPSHPKGSPRQTPPVQGLDASLPGHTSRRNATTRSIKTSDRELYQPLNLNELRRAAGSNDIRTVVRILDVFNNDLDDPKSLIIAAKAGYDEVINMLFGFSVTNPDPDPLDDMPPDSATPILAAIGRESLKVIELFLSQPAFNPTRLINGETYYEIAKRRGGTLWKEEEHLLKDAFNKYSKSHGSSTAKQRSPDSRRDGRGLDHDAKPPSRRDEQSVSQSHKRPTNSPKARDTESVKSQHRNSHSIGPSKDVSNSTKRGPGRPKKDESSSSATQFNDEAGSLGPPNQKPQPRRPESDGSPENEGAVKPRRKLVSGKEFRGERELDKQRRGSAATIFKEKREVENSVDKLAAKSNTSATRVSQNRNSHDELPSEKQMDKEKSRPSKRDDSKDRLTAVRGESPFKRPRNSETPPRSGMQEVTTSYEESGGPPKRRRLDAESTSKPGTERAPSSSPDHRVSNAKIDSTREMSTLQSDLDGVSRGIPSHPSHKRVDPHGTSGPSSNEEAFSEETAKIRDLTLKASVSDRPAPTTAHTVSSMSEADDKREAKARRDKEELEAKRKEETEKIQVELRRTELAREERLAKEQATREEELRRQQEEDQRKERQRQEDIEAHTREQERQRALYLEQEKQRQKDLERRRAQLQEQQRAERARIEEEKNKERLSKLPLLLRWLDGAKDPKTQDVATLFRVIEGVRYDTIKPEATGQPNGREQWMLNTHVAVLLGEKDLQLSRYTAWERIPLSPAMKQAVWGIQNGLYSLYEPGLSCLRSQLPEQLPSSGQLARKAIETCKTLFFQLDLFFVKVSEFMFVVPNFPHLRNLEMIVKYRELFMDFTSTAPAKWRGDPDTDPNQAFAPQPSYFMNGELIKQREAPRTKTSTTSFGERKVPRRGLVQVFPHEPDYYTLAKEQGLYHLLPPDPQATTGQNGAPNQVNGIAPSESSGPKSINGGGLHPGSSLGGSVPSNGVPPPSQA